MQINYKILPVPFSYKLNQTVFLWPFLKTGFISEFSKILLNLAVLQNGLLI